MVVDLEIAGGKNHQCLRSKLSRWRHLATISFLLFSVVLGSAREMCVFSIRHRWHILTLLLYDGARLRMDQYWLSAHPSAPRCGFRESSCGHACGGWRRPCVQWTSPWNVWGESDVLLGGASGLHSTPVDKVGGLALPLQLRPAVAALGSMWVDDPVTFLLCQEIILAMLGMLL